MQDEEAMTPIHDPTVELLNQTGTRMSTVSDLPSSISGTNKQQMTDNLLRLHATIGEQLVALAGAVFNAQGWVDHPTEAHFREVEARVRGDRAIIDAIQRLVAGVSAEEALSTALRVCAGCIDGAKALRPTDRYWDNGHRVEIAITPEERKERAREVDARCSLDQIHAAGVAIGPLDMRIRHNQTPIFNGIEPALLTKHFAEYFRRYPPRA